ncbi:hypothetical protein Taro_039090, partial [Colocasia esculenta]|nr:hypothetical protein [Colocasia esculenta]
GKNLKNSGKNLGDPSSPRILLLLASLPGPATPWHELGPAMRLVAGGILMAGLAGVEGDGGCTSSTVLGRKSYAQIIMATKPAPAVNIGVKPPSFTDGGELTVFFTKDEVNYYYEDFLKSIAGNLGQVLQIYEPTLALTQTSEAFICVELDISKAVKSTLRAWNKQVFGDINDTMNKWEKEVHIRQDNFDINPSSVNRATLGEANANLQRAVRCVEVFWAQKARLQWLDDGDKNTTFYHVVVQGNRRRNKIHRLQVDGTWCEDQEALSKEAVRYYESLLHSNNHDVDESLLDVLVNSVNKDKALSWNSYRWWRDAKQLFSRASTQLSHVYRETNELADSLANLAVKNKRNDVFWGGGVYLMLVILSFSHISIVDLHAEILLNSFLLRAQHSTNIFMQKMSRHTHQWCRHINTDSKAKCVKMLRLCRHMSRVCRHEWQFSEIKPTQVDTLSEQVDTRPSSQNSQFADLGQQVDTLKSRSTRDPLPRTAFYIFWTVCRHYHQGRSTHYGNFSS